jgi:predicted dithiol-disulfide oxidoreductase (DUF899 family)
VRSFASHRATISPGYSRCDLWRLLLPSVGAHERLRAPTGAVHHTYSTYDRGVEALIGFYQYLDMAPKGRNEDTVEFPRASRRRHDEYELP